MDSGGDSFGAICGIVLFSALNPWCNTRAFGANGCCNSNSTAGCCGSCFYKSFNEDRFDEQPEVKENSDTNGQLIPTKGMSVQPAA